MQESYGDDDDDQGGRDHSEGGEYLWSYYFNSI